MPSLPPLRPTLLIAGAVLVLALAAWAVRRRRATSRRRVAPVVPTWPGPGRHDWRNREHRNTLSLVRRDRGDSTRQQADARRIAFQLACAGMLGSDAVQVVTREASCRHATAVAAVDLALEVIGPEQAYWNCPEHWAEWRPHLLVRFDPDAVDPDDVFAMDVTFDIDHIDGSDPT